MTLTERCRRRCAISGDDGFTLVELLVVLLIIGILLAVSIPTYLAITHGANADATQADLNTALTGSDVFWTTANQGSFVGVVSGSSSVSDLSQIDVGLTFSSAASTGPDAVSVSLPTSAGNTVVELVAYSPGENTCWGVAEVKAAQTTALTGLPGVKAVGTYYFVYDQGSASKTTCVASSASAAAANIKDGGWPAS